MTTAVGTSTGMPWDATRVPGQSDMNRRDILDSGVTVLRDGRLDINLPENSLVGLLARFKPSPSTPSRPEPTEKTPREDTEACPFRLNIVIQVVGSRGDVQPFIAVGKALKQYGHRVRLATHLTFKDSVKENGLEFFDIGGHPAELMIFMVENTGLLPQFKTIRSGAIQRHRRDMDNIIHGCWRSCFETGDATQLHQISDDTVNGVVGSRQRPFVADAIIANPPSFAHIHCAEKLGIPLTIMFTMPWSPTQAFPHPLANIRRYNTKPTLANAASYAIVDMIHWQGLGDIINRFRRKTLRLDILDAVQAQGIVHRLDIPHAYLWSPALLRKPDDWSDNIDVCGFTFLSSASNYTPPDDLVAFLEAGPPPIYVGFGSIVVDNPQRLCEIIRGAVHKCGQRAIISKGWGGLGGDGLDIEDGNYLLGNCPHDWLFPHVSCVVHHGGAGTTATGLKFGRPTVVVPFFGDQPFWGAIVARDGVGPPPIPYKDLTVEKLANAILEALNPSPRQKSHEISETLQHESGVRNAVSSFHGHLHYERMRCALCPLRPAVWWVKSFNLALSAFAATVLVEAGLLDPHGLELHRSEEYDTSRDPENPLSAGLQVLFGSMAKFVTDMGDMALEAFNLVSGRWCYAYLHGRLQNEPEDWCKCHETISVANQDTPHTGTRVVCADNWHALSGGSFGGRSKRKAWKRYFPTLGNCLPATAAHTSHLAQQILDIIIIPPMEISSTLSKGLRNPHSLFHHTGVENSPSVSGIRDGLSAARTEFVSGICNGAKELVTQPHRGLKEAGSKGLIRGMGKGVAGVVSSPLAGLFGLAAYPLTGLHKHLQGSISEEIMNPIRHSRIAQGTEEFRASSFDEREDVINRWRALVNQAAAKRKKGPRKSPIL